MGKYRNIFFSEAIALIEPKLCISHWKVLYKRCVFYVDRNSKMTTTAGHSFYIGPIGFLAHLTQRVVWAIVTTDGPSSVVRPSVRSLTFHILINSSEATGPIWTKLWWNGPWMAPFQNCVRWSRLPTKMAAKLKIEKRGD